MAANRCPIEVNLTGGCFHLKVSHTRSKVMCTLLELSRIVIVSRVNCGAVQMNWTSIFEINVLSSKPDRGKQQQSSGDLSNVMQ